MATVALIDGILKLTRSGRTLTRADTAKIREILYYLLLAKEQNTTEFESLDEFLIASNALQEWAYLDDNTSNTTESCLVSIQDLDEYSSLSETEVNIFLKLIPNVLESSVDFDSIPSGDLKRVLVKFFECVHGN